MVHLWTLGTLDLQSPEGRELRSVLAQPKRFALLAYLALATPRGFHRRDTLLTLFWPEHDTERARNALSQAVHFLRRTLGKDVLVSRGDELGLDWAAVWCDAIAFEEALGAGRLTDALELYRGELLDGFHVSDGAPEFGRWLEAERERLAARHAQALERLAELREEVGDYGGAAAWWRRLAARDRFSARVALRLMRALAAAGDPAGAIQYARIHETLLREELGVAAGPEVAELARQLQSGGAGEPRPSHGVAQRSSRGASDAEAAGMPEPSGPGATSGVLAGTGTEHGLAEAPASPSGRPRSRRSLAALSAAGLALCVVGGGAVTFKNGAPESSTPSIRSLAVLPLEDLSGDSAHRSFVDGMHDALITELARYPDLTVISRTSVLRYRETKKSLPEIARELKVDGVVEGTVLREGGRVRMNAQLVHGPTDRHLWARSYARDLRDVLLLQGELADTIARELRVAATPVERRRPTASGPPDSVPGEMHLRELYLRGRHAELSRSLPGVQMAKEYYRQAIEADSTFAPGYAGLADAYGLMAMYGYAPARPALDSARMMARKAVALDGTLPETRAALGTTLADAGDFVGAEREFRRAIDLDPSDARTRFQYSMLLVALGRGRDALREANRAAELDPFAPRGVVLMQRSAHYLITGQRPYLGHPAGTRQSSILKLPGEPWARRANAYDLAEAGRCAEARAEIRPTQELAPGTVQALVALAKIDWWCDERLRARALLAQIKRRPDARDQASHIAMAHTLFGDTDSAFVWLGHQQWTMPKLTDLRAARWLDPLRSDSRYAELLQRLGLGGGGQN